MSQHLRRAPTTHPAWWPRWVRTDRGGAARSNADPRPLPKWRAYLPWLVALPFSVSGVIHLADPATFTSIVPHFLPLPTELVYVSGAAELICAVGLWRRDRWAGIAAAALLLVIWPANFQDSITAQQGHDVATAVLLWIRLPVQIPLIWFALQSGRARSSGAAT
jgi:uncharacterized membrane protein